MAKKDAWWTIAGSSAVYDSLRYTGARKTQHRPTPNTKKAYKSYIKGLSQWIRATQDAPDSFFEEDGSLDLSIFLPFHFEQFLMDKMNAGTIKISTLMGYRSAVKDVYRQKRFDLPTEYNNDLKTTSTGLREWRLKTIKRDENVAQTRSH
ncbi:hypothetical protein PHMEG_00038392 [Phytophthora megakarya]|uniref:Core-binding (CB) domain-containing protein n=1 Tax=Phytophthora megakarya TaxID=4795 RepID=A0A225UHZ1_9STRA|nr:hypothetical protein PHMEG_00038392 [Phytophthora megakarya]